jgi:hypothetical protein
MKPDSQPHPEWLQQLIESYVQSKGPIGRPTIEDNPVGLIVRHFPSLVRATTTRKTAQIYCIVCSYTGERGKSAPKHVIRVTFVTLDFV